MALHLHRAAGTDRLADGLAEVLALPAGADADPFAEELVVVPARGVERWLAQRLSHRLGVGPRGGDGVCAGVRFTSPASLTAQLLERADDDPWTPDRLVWPVLATVDAVLDEPWAAPLARHLGHDRTGVEAQLRRDRRYAVARRLAGLFASYATQRPQLVTDWREGRDTDGAGAEIDADLAWQPELYRRLLTRMAPVAAAAPDERLVTACERLADGEVPRLPARFSLFGHTRLSATDVALLRAAAARRDVHLWLPHPSPALWSALAPQASAGPVRRDVDETTATHPLLASLGRDTRELQRTLAGVAGEDEPVAEPRAGRGARDDLLAWLQADLHADAEPDAGTRAARVLRPGDRSVQVHACHGPTRQVDVLREVLVGLLADDPTLEPRDILVMTPDVDTYAPLVQAGFGMQDVADEPGRGGHPAHRLRVRLADRGLGWTNPLLAVAAAVVSIAGGRASATEVRDLAAAEPVRRRFGFTDDDLDQVADWAEAASVRWGLDADSRRGVGLDSFDENTWHAGLDRVLLGVALAAEEHRVLGGRLPVDDVASNAVDLAGRLAELCDRLTALCARLRDEAPLGVWLQALSDGVAALTDVPRADLWQVAEVDRVLARVADAEGADASRTPLRLADVRALLGHLLDGRPTRANFRTGTLTVCTMVPMRSVPHRVVCLLGLDDGEFPRNPAIDGDDVLARSPLTGERDARSEDRQLFLDAVLAARETLVVTYTGANEYSGQQRPPAVPLGELLDTLDVTATPAAPASRVSDQVRTFHPLQPFDERNFERGALVGAGAFSFDAAARDGAEAARGPSARPSRFLAAPLDPVPAPLPDLALDDLLGFLLDPVGAFVKRSLGASVLRLDEERRDAIPLELDALERWGIGDRLLRSVVEGRDPHFARTVERLSGTLPPRALGEKIVDDILSDIVAIYRVALEHLGEDGRTVPVETTLRDGRRLTGSVSGVHGQRLLRVGYSRLGARQRLRTWAELVAVSAALPDESWTGHVIGRGKNAPLESVLRHPAEHAGELLHELVDLYDRGMREPLPMPVRTASAWACATSKEHAVPSDRERDWAAGRVWEPDDFSLSAESQEPAHEMVYGPRSTLTVLTEPVREDERWGDAPHRLGQLAQRLWSPLRAREVER